MIGVLEEDAESIRKGVGKLTGCYDASTVTYTGIQQCHGILGRDVFRKHL